MSERNYYVLCDDNCRFPAMTSEQVIAAIFEATGNTPTNIDGAFITKLREGNGGAALTVWIGTTAEYNAIEAAGERVENCLYITTDDDIIAEVIANNARTRAECERLTAENETIKKDLQTANDEIKAMYGDFLGLSDQETIFNIDGNADMLQYDYFIFVDSNYDVVVKFDMLDKVHDPDGEVDYISGRGLYWKSGSDITTASLVIEKNGGAWYISSHYKTNSGTVDFAADLRVYGCRYTRKPVGIIEI